MSSDLPEFESDEELEAWFDEARLSVDDLEPALEIDVGDRVELVFEEPWESNLSSVTSASSGTVKTRVPA